MKLSEYVVIISPENNGFDITAWGKDTKLATMWKKKYNDAYHVADIFANFYQDENGQSLSIHNISVAGGDK